MIEGTNLGAWLATAERGEPKPVCVCDMDDHGLTLTIYATEKDGIVGVVVYNPDGKLTEVVGWLPGYAAKNLLL